MRKRKVNKKHRENRQTKSKEENKPRWWISSIVDMIMHWLSILLITIILNSCTIQSHEEKLENEFEQNLEKLFDDPTRLNNTEENKELFKQFSDSGSFNSNSQKSGIWNDYKIEDSFNDIPVTVYSTSGDTIQISRTVIVKYTGEYENGKKVGIWKRFELIYESAPFRWHEKGKI